MNTTLDHPNINPLDSRKLMAAALEQGLAIPAFNIPYLPMMEPTVQALRDTRTMGFITVARLEWIKFEAGSLADIRSRYEACGDRRFTRLHLDHVPVIDEDNQDVNYTAIIQEALDLGYDSVMIDGSRLPLNENIAATRSVTAMAHAAGRPLEAELGAVLGHESGPLPPYEELWRSGRGFTDPEEAQRFVAETEVDWLSVAIGNIHGAISGAARHAAKIEARLHIPRLETIRTALAGRVPLVLHGGSGIKRKSLEEGMRHGIAKINVATTTRQAYEKHRANPAAAEQAVYEATRMVITEELGIAGSADRLAG